jgi:hypothetical protein
VALVYFAGYPAEAKAELYDFHRPVAFVENKLARDVTHHRPCGNQ